MSLVAKLFAAWVQESEDRVDMPNSGTALSLELRWFVWNKLRLQWTRKTELMLQCQHLSKRLPSEADAVYSATFIFILRLLLLLLLYIFILLSAFLFCRPLHLQPAECALFPLPIPHESSPSPCCSHSFLLPSPPQTAPVSGGECCMNQH